jgi:hypothetical protein
MAYRRSRAQTMRYVLKILKIVGDTYFPKKTTTMGRDNRATIPNGKLNRRIATGKSPLRTIVLAVVLQFGSGALYRFVAT